MIAVHLTNGAREIEYVTNSPVLMILREVANVIKDGDRAGHLMKRLHGFTMIDPLSATVTVKTHKGLLEPLTLGTVVLRLKKSTEYYTFAQIQEMFAPEDDR
jgi:hypothetical protein